MDKKVKVVVIDTGALTTHKLLKKYDNISGISIKFKNEEIIFSDNFVDNYGHGTAINQIIKSHCKDCEIFNIKLFETEEVEEYELIKTLEYIYKNIECDILNLSLGICVLNEYEKFYNICEKIKQKGIIIVSAFDNNGAISYPASFDNVIGVTNSKNIKKSINYIFNESNIINIFAYGSIQRLAWINPELLMLSGNSFACPHITGIIANILNKEKLNFNELLNKLKEKSNNSITYNKHIKNKIDNKYFGIKKAIIFPFNKEMHSLLRYYDILKFDIIDVYDTKYSFNVSASTKHLLKDKNIKDLIVKNYENIDFNSFDTIIIGHTDELSSLINKKELKKNIIIKALKNKKNIYSFDNLEEYNDIILKYNIKSKIFYPKISKKNMPEDTFGKMYKYSKPIVAIFGTSSKQGKFTLQLGLRKYLKNIGYNVGQIGTEPSALLYGMDNIYPIGYNSSVYLSQNEQIIYINNMINNLCIKDTEIIIIGSQSNTISYDISNISLIPTNQFNFLVGINPDVVVLCVNIYDTFDYIERTINFIESVGTCKVIAINVFPMTIKEDWTSIYSSKRKISNNEFIKFKENINSKINIPIFNLDGISCIKDISNKIIKYFTDDT